MTQLGLYVNCIIVRLASSKETQLVSIKNKRNWLIPFQKIIAVYSEDHKKLTNTLTVRKMQVTVKPDDTYSYRWVLRVKFGRKSETDIILCLSIC
jgi:hypothetical protein